MPTATSLSAFTLINNGPLTTTFTAPASCATEYRTMAAVAGTLSFLRWPVECEWLPPADCNPYGSAVRSIISSVQGSDNPVAGKVIEYHSPGLVCPSGWVTVGAAARPNPTSTSVSGVFVMSELVPTGGSSPRIVQQPYLDVLLDALDPGETAVACCPSAYTGFLGDCYSAIPTSVFTPSTACVRLLQDPFDSTSGTWTIGGKTITAELLNVTGTSPILRSTTTFMAAEATEYMGVAALQGVLLVHEGTDAPTPASTTASVAAPTASTEPTTTPTGPEPPKLNAAVQVKGENKLVVAAIVSFLALGFAALLM